MPHPVKAAVPSRFPALRGGLGSERLEGAGPPARLCAPRHPPPAASPHHLAVIKWSLSPMRTEQNGEGGGGCFPSWFSVEPRVGNHRPQGPAPWA